MRHSIAPLLAAVALAAGCQNSSKDDPHGNYKVPSIENTYEMVAAGKAPLAFVVQSGGWIKILDVTTNTMIHTAQLPADPAGLMIRIDDQVPGITYSTVKGDKPITVLPIDPEHRYELYYQR